MTLRAEQAEAALIDAACARLRDQLGPDAASGCEALLRQLYHRVPLDDLAGRSERDLCGAAIALWELARTRRPGATTVRAYNPAPDRHGWHSANTIVEVVTDYMPFLVDSVAMELAAGGYAIELSLVPVIEVLRDQRGRLVELLGPGSGVAGVQAESVMQFEVDREAQPERLDALADGIQRVLADVSAAVQDWPLMRERMQAIADDFRAAPAPLDQLQARELTAFLEWVADGNFIFLGHGEYDLLREEGEDLLRAVPGSLLGVFRHRSAGTSRSFARLPAEVRAMARAPEPLILTKANSRSTVHRPLYLDYIGVKRFSGEQVVGERRFLGLYTSDAADASPREIPLLADKVARVTRRAAFAAESHNAKALARTLDSYPLDELFQSSDDELFAVAMGIVALGERDRVGVFVRRDPYRRFVSCLVFVPRDRFNADNRERMDRILRDAFAATDIDWAVRLTASKLVRIHYIVRCEIVPFDRDAAQFSRDVADLERLIADATRPWTEQLAGALRNAHGDERGNQLLRDYRAAFPIGYRADWQAGAAVQDIERAEALASGDRVVMTVRAARETEHGSLRCKLLSPGERIALSDVLPILENMGLRVADERPYELTPAGRDPIWVYDIGVACELDADLRDQARRTALQDAFTGVWRGELENDRLGALVLLAGLTGREVSLLRALLKYLRQAGARFSDRYMQQALTGNPGLARRLVELFCVRLDPDSYDLGLAQRLAIELQRAIDDLPSADQAGILRDCLAAIQATVRTSYFQRGADGPAANPQLAFKLDPALLPFLPRPRPAIETFVYSPRVEGVYLRAARVARGAIRWSDRREDFRAEALDCMRAEIVDNAAIVAGGAYGAFVIKRPPSTGGRAALLREAADCCRLFASGLLDLTDNVVAGAIVAPARAVRHDGDDPYLVLGADARTAALAGIAHDVAAQRGFWLADSFASPGLRPQDPGPSAIGAQGTWESVRRHARGLARATRSEALTVVAIGEAPGSLFGSEQAPWPRIRLIGAVGREHVLIDPDPDPDAGRAERRRLRELPAGSWGDYRAAAISAGGGVFSRSERLVALSDEARQALSVQAASLSPDDLIRALLCAPVDLLWSARTGTFVKAPAEGHAPIGDKANDGVRIDATQLRCRIVGETAGAAFTQRARIEYARAGGAINIAAIDAAAAVNWSDHDVNLKILLDAAVADGELTIEQREQLLGTLAGAVADRVLGESAAQALAVALERSEAAILIDLHARLIADLDRRGVLDGGREQLPGDEAISQRKAAGEGLTGPELAMLLSHAKVALHRELLASDLAEDEDLAEEFAGPIPRALRDRFGRQLRNHRLRREIVTTELVNSIIDCAGITFVSRLAEETGAAAAHIARAYAVAIAVFEMRRLWREVEQLDERVDERTQLRMLVAGRKLVTRATRWLIADLDPPLDIAAAVRDFAPGVATLWEALPGLLSDLDRDAWQARVAQFTGAGVPAALARRVASMDAVFFTFDIVDSARATNASVPRAGAIHFGLDGRLETGWLRDRIIGLPRADIWQTLARSALRDRLYKTHRALTAAVLATSGGGALQAGAAIDAWVAANEAQVQRYLDTIAEIRAAPGSEFMTLFVAIHELASLTGPAPL